MSWNAASFVVYLRCFIDNARIVWFKRGAFMTELITSGVELMLVGMGIVYAFLVMLIAAIHVMGVLVSRFFPEPSIIDGLVVNNGIDQSSVAAISVAVHQYRTKHK